MEIIVGKTAGFCYGVKRAVEGAINEAQNTKEEIYCLGEIVHNKEVVKKLENLGVKCIEKIEESKGKTLIRAHGVEKKVYEFAKENNMKIEDYTCPKVIAIHETAKKYSNEGYCIWLFGAKEHPENIGTASFCGNDYKLIESVEDIDNAIKDLKNKKLLIISQTTFSVEKFEKFTKYIKENISKDIEVVVKNTICRATEIRQEETNELSKTVDSMIVIGGKNSSNTKKLFEVAKKNCKCVFWVETAEELKSTKIEGEKVGIIAGASTPKESIEAVVHFLKNNTCNLHKI